MAAKDLPSQAYLRECFSYDRETGILVWRERPLHHFSNIGIMRRINSRCAGNVVGKVPALNGYLVVNLNGRPRRLHRLIWRMETGESPPEIDHRNHVRADNRWENLRAATNAQNTHNQRGHSKIGMPKGVHYRYGRWRVRIAVNGSAKYIGSYETVEEAVASHNEAAKKYHGDFAYLADEEAIQLPKDFRFREEPKKRDLPKGVYRHGNGFRPILQFRGVVYNLGTFPTVSEALAAYSEVAGRLHNEAQRNGENGSHHM